MIDDIGMTGIAMVDYSELGYQEMDVTKYVNAPSREELVMDVMEGLDAGQVMCHYFTAYRACLDWWGGGLTRLLMNSSLHPCLVLDGNNGDTRLRRSRFAYGSKRSFR